MRANPCRKGLHTLAKFVIEYLFEKTNTDVPQEDSAKEEVLVEFSVHELKSAYEKSSELFKLSINHEDIEDTLFYLSRIEAIKIEGGFLVIYNRLTIKRIEQDVKKRYTKEDYQKLNQFYENKVQQIHIVGEYARKMINDYKEALQFAEDYFQLNYFSFLNKYFPGSRQHEIKRNITPAKLRQLFGELSPTQLKIINDNETKHIVVAAGPGSGKTKVLVHKLASMLIMEDVKHEQLLMLTFSRAAATEFKKRLLKLIGNAANYIEIKTFHSYCFDFLGKVGSIEKSDEIIRTTVQKIRNKEVEVSRITKTVLVIDEAQDMNEDEFNLINILMDHNEDMRVIAVGDDDQNIYGFRGSNSKYLKNFITQYKAIKYELVENYRSKRNLVDFSNQFVKQISFRLKQTPSVARQNNNGRIKIVHYQSENLIVPVVQDILTAELSGTTCVLTKTNEEAFQITGLLLRNRVPAKLIQSNEGFSLYNLIEVRDFLVHLKLTDDIYIISDDAWENAKQAILGKYQHSTKLEILENIIKDFETINPKRKYKSDLEVFIRESKLEDFYKGGSETIFVSTIHKAKGKEFDNVFLMLENYDNTTDEAKRLLYVAMTRAKSNLIIHLNSNFLDRFTADNLERFENPNTYPPPNQLTMRLSFKDVWLGYFVNRQNLISGITSGETLTISADERLEYKGKCVLKFSRKFKKQIESLKERHYKLKSAKVDFIVYWKKEDTKQEIKIILPELYFERKTEVPTENTEKIPKNQASA